MDLGELYDYLAIKLSVPETRGWLLVDTPLPLFIITVVYLYLVLYAGPRYMKDRPPFNLRAFILFYNLLQILINAWLVKEYISGGWFTEYSLICNYPSDLSKPSAMKLVTTGWFTLFSRLFDYIETGVFVLRKKQNQVSFLHVFHHVVVIFYGWIYLKYAADERLTYMALINCAVHVCMYMYYFAAAWSTECQHILSPIKPYVTKLQLMQLVVVILPLLQYYISPSCKMRVTNEVYEILFIVFIATVVIFIYLFYDFYKKTYSKQKKSL